MVFLNLQNWQSIKHNLYMVKSNMMIEGNRFNKRFQSGVDCIHNSWRTWCWGYLSSFCRNFINLLKMGCSLLNLSLIFFVWDILRLTKFRNNKETCFKNFLIKVTVMLSRNNFLLFTTTTFIRFCFFFDIVCNFKDRIKTFFNLRFYYHHLLKRLTSSRQLKCLLKLS